MYNCNNCLWASRDLCKTCPRKEAQENNIIVKEVKSNDKNVKELV